MSGPIYTFSGLIYTFLSVGLSTLFYSLLVWSDANLLCCKLTDFNISHKSQPNRDSSSSTSRVDRGGHRGKGIKSPRGYAVNTGGRRPAPFNKQSLFVVSFR